jgi:hypothetical protein
MPTGKYTQSEIAAIAKQRKNKQWYDPTEDEIGNAVELLLDNFGDMPFFPKRDTAMRSTAKGLARICWFLPYNEIMLITNPYDPELHTEKGHPRFGNRIDSDVLVELALAKFDKFPGLPELRKLHWSIYPSRDGLSPSDLDELG